jgi:DNA-binding Lrp family transcriptional regulator
MSKTLDRLDLALLNLLQENNVATAEALAQSVPLSPSAITRRIRRLRDEGLIARDVSILSPSLTEHRLRALIHVQLKEHAPENGLAAFRERLRQADEVQYCAEITGPFDLLAIIVTRDMATFNAFADAMLEAEPAVRRYETSFVRREIKNAPIVRLDEDDIRR